MTKCRKSIIHISLYIVLFVTLAGLLFLVYGKYQFKQLEKDLKWQAVNTISHDGKEFELINVIDNQEMSRAEKSELMRLARYVLEVRFDPKFALVGTSLEEFEASLVDMTKSRDDIAEAYSRYETYVLDKDLIYPLDFLNQQMQTEKQRRELIAHPSYENAYSYHSSLLTTLDAYQKFMDKYLPALEEAAEKEKINRVGFYNGLTTASHMREVFSKYNDSSSKAKEITKKRWECLNSTFKKCEKVKSPEIAAVQPIEIEISTVALENLDILRTYTSNVYNQVEQDTSSQSLGVLSQSQCTVYKPMYFYYIWTASLLGGENLTFRSFNLEEIFVIDMEKEYEMTESPYNETYLEKGGPRYVHQPLLNYYMCPDLASDVANSLRLDWLWQQDFPLSPLSYKDTELADFIESLEQAYRELRSADVLNEQDAHDYLSAINLVIENDKKILSVADRMKLEDTIVAYANKNVGLPRAINALTRNNNLIPALDYFGVEPNASNFLYLRFGPKLLLGGYTPNVIAEDIKLIEKLIEADGDFLEKYSEIKGEFSKEEFIDNLIRANKMTGELATMADRPY